MPGVGYTISMKRPREVEGFALLPLGASGSEVVKVITIKKGTVFQILGAFEPSSYLGRLFRGFVGDYLVKEIGSEYFGRIQVIVHISGKADDGNYGLDRNYFMAID